MRSRRRVLLLSGLALAATLLWWQTRRGDKPASTRPVPTSVAPLPASSPLRRPWTPGPPLPVQPDRDADRGPACLLDHGEHCLAGDVWMFDSCGRPQEKVEECGEQECKDDGCELPPSVPCLEPVEGRCDGDVVRLCTRGRPLSIDCAAKGLRCGLGAEGAECKPLIPLLEQCEGPDRCDQDVLVRCLDGQLQRTDCAALRSQCARLPGAGGPACVLVVPTVLMSQGCGPCGCTVTQRGAETCDNRDEDGDGLVDEGLDCGPVPVRAFIITGGGGQTSHAREDVEAEIARANLEFARTPEAAGLSFVLADVTQVSDSALLSMDDDEVQALTSDPRIHPSDLSFYVPIVFTDTLVAGGETPKPGLSTLPNGVCGGVKEGRSPEVGMIAVAKARYATTLVHELGHFLGLCHTHDQQEATPFLAYADASGRLRGCVPSCAGEGDGICDTPFDPGPELCSYDASCSVACRVDAAPDPTNLMSYYARCRARFSEEQMALMQHTVALRRGWHRCLDGACACQLGEQDCPTDMSCRPMLSPGGEPSARCGFDGPRGAGADCAGTADCGQGTVCMTSQTTQTQRCVRPCASNVEGCTCVPAGEGLSVCLEDLTRSNK